MIRYIIVTQPDWKNAWGGVKDTKYTQVDGYVPPSAGFPYWTIYLEESTQAIFLDMQRVYAVKVVESKK